MTRLYIRENASPDITPSVDAGWESSASPFARRPLRPTTDAADTLTTVSGFGSTTGQDRCHRQLVGPPMAAGLTFNTSITYKCYVQALESATNDNIASRMNVRILSADGTTVRHTVLSIADYSTATEWNTALRNKAFANGDAGVGSYTTVAGDRLVVEIGHNDAAGASISGSSRWGSAGSADLGENETSTSTSERPWFDTSLTLHWAALPTGIASAEAFGTQQLNLQTSPSGIESAEAFGTATISTAAPTQTITGAGAIASAEAFGTDQLDLHTAPSAIASAEAFGTDRLDVQVVASGIASAEAFGTPSTNPTISPTAIASAEAFGTARLDLHAAPSAIASSESFGAATLEMQVQASAIATAEAFGTARADLIVTTPAIASAEALGSSTLGMHVQTSAIVTAEAFGSDRLDLHAAPSAIASSAAFGSSSVTSAGGGLAVAGAGAIASVETFGSARLDLRTAPNAIASSEAFGTAVLGIDDITASGIATAEVFGVARLDIGIAPAGISTTETFGTPLLSMGGDLTISPTGIASEESFEEPPENDALWHAAVPPHRPTFPMVGGGVLVPRELPHCAVAIDDD